MFFDDYKKGFGFSKAIKKAIRGYKNGTTYVPQTKKYLVHKGEMVIPVKEATALRRKMKLKNSPVKKALVKKKTNKK